MTEFQKSQGIRLVDIWFIGPYLIYLMKKGTVSDLDKTVLGILGVSTIFYNLNNYMKNREINA
jgi:hypothetical protein